MKRIMLIGAIAIAMAVNAEGQKLRGVPKMLSKGKIEKAETKLKKMIEDKKEVSSAQAMLSDIYVEKKYGKVDSVRAYRCACQAVGAWSRQSEKEKKAFEGTYGLSIDRMEERIAEIGQKIFDTAAEQDEPGGYEKARRLLKATSGMSEGLKAKMEGWNREIDEYLKDYDTRSAYRRALKSGDIDVLMAYKKKYDGVTPLADSAERRAWEIAKERLAQMKLIKFGIRYKESVYADSAFLLCYKQLVEGRQWNTLIDYSMIKPALPKSEEALRVARENLDPVYDFCRASGDYWDIKIFKRDYPSYTIFSEKDSMINYYSSFEADFKNSQLNLLGEYDPKLAERFDFFINKMAPTEMAYVALLRRVSGDIKAGRYSEAVKVLNKYKPLFGKTDRAKKIEGTIEILTSARYGGGSASKLGTNVNLTQGEGENYAPVLSYDGKTLYFCHKDKESEDAYYSQNVGGRWMIAQPVDGLNGVKNKDLKHGWHYEKNRWVDYGKPVSESNDCVTLITSTGNRCISFHNGAFLEYAKSMGKWYRSSSKLSEKKFGKKETWIEVTGMSPDGRALFFAWSESQVGLAHPIGYYYHGSFMGNRDLYVIVKNEAGEWSDPINLGNIVNTPYDERSPYIAQDGKTLYFISDGHGGIGRGDVYVSRRLREDSWTEWSEPENLGRVINTVNTEMDFYLGIDGRTCYYSRKDTEDGKRSVYVGELPADKRPGSVVVVEGSLRYTDGEKAEAVRKGVVTWCEPETGRTIGEVDVDEETGRFVVVLEPNKEYIMYASSESGYPVEMTVATGREAGRKTIELTMERVDESNAKGYRSMNIEVDLGLEFGGREKIEMDKLGVKSWAKDWKMRDVRVEVITKGDISQIRKELVRVGIPAFCVVRKQPDRATGESGVFVRLAQP